MKHCASSCVGIKLRSVCVTVHDNAKFARWDALLFVREWLIVSLKTDSVRSPSIFIFSPTTMWRGKPQLSREGQTTDRPPLHQVAQAYEPHRDIAVDEAMTKFHQELLQLQNKVQKTFKMHFLLDVAHTNAPEVLLWWCTFQLYQGLLTQACKWTHRRLLLVVVE